MADRIILTVDDVEYSEWTQAGVRRSLEEASAAFSLTVAERASNLGPPLRIRPGSACMLAVDDGSRTLPVVTGYVDDAEIGTARDSHETSITGRSKTADLIDCSVDIPSTYSGLTLYELARALAAPYGVTVREGPAGASGDPLVSWKPEPDETVHETLERAARLRRCLLCDDGDGQLVIRRIDDIGAQPVAFLTMPGNIESATLRCGAAGLFTNYEVMGQADGRDVDYYRDTLASIKAAATDGTLTRYRLRRVMMEGAATPETALDRARWEAATRAGRATLYTCQVGSWRIEPEGDLWMPGMLVHVADTYQGVDADLLLVDAEYTYGADGTRCNLSLAPLAGYLPESPDEGEARRAKKSPKRAKAQAGIDLWAEVEAVAR
jgi:prophage tail gpP-like protein